MKNKNVGAKVEIKKLTLRINPQEKWVYGKKLKGVIVERGNHEHYYYTCTGAHTYPTKHTIENDIYETFAIKLDDGVVDIAGNNIVVARDYEIKFLETTTRPTKIITEKSYLNALNIIEKYKLQNNK